MAFTLPALPYAKDALAPHITAETLEFHHGKHHNAYVTNLNKLLEGKPEASKSLEEIIMSSDGGVFNNAAQIWNHTFYWNSMKPNGGGEPTGEVKDMLVRDFGSVEAFKTEFVAKGVGQFGSGWVWLVLDGDKLKVVNTPNAETPLTTSAKPLLTCDVWEHAYYIDARNNRKGFIESFLEKLVDWDFIAENLKG